MKTLDLAKILSGFLIVSLVFSFYLGFKGFSLSEGVPLLNPVFGFAVFVVFGFILPIAWELPSSIRNKLRYLLLVYSLVIVISLFSNSLFFELLTGEEIGDPTEQLLSSIMLFLYLPLVITLLARKIWYPLALVALGTSNLLGFMLYLFAPHGALINIIIFLVSLANSISSGSMVGYSMATALGYTLQHITYASYVVVLLLLGLTASAEKEMGGFLIVEKPILEKLKQIIRGAIKILLVSHILSVLLLMIASPATFPSSLIGIYGLGLKWIGL